MTIDEGAMAKLREAAELLKPLGKQGEDYIWRPVTKAIDLIQEALLSHPTGGGARRFRSAFGSSSQI